MLGGLVTFLHIGGAEWRTLCLILGGGGGGGGGGIRLSKCDYLL
jgi:hypothetical protein